MIVDIPDVVEKINQNLPEQIRVWGYVRTIRSFHAKTLCDSRIYEYLIPTYVFNPDEKASCTQTSQSMTMDQSVEVKAEGSTDQKIIEIPVATIEEMIENRKYRITPEILNLVRTGFKEYEGIMFTCYELRAFIRTSSQIFCSLYKVGDPKIVKDTEWLSLKVQGQSFMLHQIRKMPVFKSYNKKCVVNGYEPIDYEKYREEIDEFKEKHIYSKIYEEECNDNTFQNWLNSIDAHKDRDFGYLNSEGVIPEWAIVKKSAQSNKEEAIGWEKNDSENDD
ncbi:5981_t:CDS:2 [Acaulospora colombiana]|uniref:5981_t:CDS:1 n=1 Tax=Acaulospora colombiana TaxID=27376 RepID=A0ACA9LAI9_9GLOM|nr:5981_t:CDS:2 [Acaulospora colombiana]